MLRQLVKPLLRVNLKPLMTTPTRLQCKSSTVPKKLVRLQKIFQQKNDLPVYLKNGQADRILYLSTLGLCWLGLAWQCWWFVTISV